MEFIIKWRNDGRVISSIDDIVASPLIVGQNVYAADGSGKVVSMKMKMARETGRRLLDLMVISGLRVNPCFSFRIRTSWYA